LANNLGNLILEHFSNAPMCNPFDKC